MLYYDIIFNRVVGDVPSSDLSLTERVIIMSTYEELQIILTTALLIVAILTYTCNRISLVRFCACGRSLAAYSILPQCDPCGAFSFIECNSYERKIAVLFSVKVQTAILIV